MRNICLVFLALFVSVCGFADEAEDRRKIYLYLEGRSIFLEQCSPCHGRLGKGDGEWAQDWTKNRPRNFRAGVFKFRTTPMGKLPTDEDLKRTISSGISGTAMPTFKGHLRDSQYEAVIEYLKHLSKRWKDPKNVAPAVVLPDAPNWMKSFAESKPHQARGKVLFTTVCASCHGPSGKGDGEAGKILMDVWGFPIAPADLTQKHFKSGDRSEDLFRTISMGLDGTPMVGFRPALSELQIWELVSYLKSIKLTGK